MANPEHELLTFRRIKSALEHINDGIQVKSTSPLAEGLEQLGCYPYADILCSNYLNCEFSVAGKPAGTFGKPDVDLILQESTASSFGKGETTVLDPTYRNGREIPAQNIDIHDRYISISSEREISAAMFVGKIVKIKLYKLAVYEEGGHFNWHMDSTHSDQHHATFLLALNTSWEGGDLKLRRNGVETSVDMHPKPDWSGDRITLTGAAFYTDTEHKVEPVTKGIRIVLQFDVEVVGWETTGGDDENEFIRHMVDVNNTRRHYKISLGSPLADNAVVTKVTDTIAGLLEDGEEEVAFAMQHLYRKRSILPEFLKGPDAQLYRALVSSFDVSLRPVILHSRTDDYGDPEPYLAIPWVREEGGKSGSDDGSEDEDSTDFGNTKFEDMTFHLPMLSAIKLISHYSYMEHTGNSAQPGETKYFGGGMFVRQKKQSI